MAKIKNREHFKQKTKKTRKQETETSSSSAHLRERGELNLLFSLL